MKLQSLLTMVVPAAFAAIPVAASATENVGYESMPPITVESANVGYSTEHPSAYLPSIRRTDGLEVTFVNHGAAAATNIELTLGYNGVAEKINKLGNFAPGSRVVYSDDFLSNLPYAGDAGDVTITAIQFADGSSWHATDSNGDGAMAGEGSHH